MTNPTYLLDTNIVSYSMKGQYPVIAERIGKLAWNEYAISVATRVELMYGLHLAPAVHPSHLRVRRLLGEIQILDWGQDAADTFALLLYQHKRDPVEHLDLMIAAHAISLNAILVTNNVKHFGRLAPLLQIENWVSEP